MLSLWLYTKGSVHQTGADLYISLSPSLLFHTVLFYYSVNHSLPTSTVHILLYFINPINNLLNKHVYVQVFGIEVYVINYDDDIMLLLNLSIYIMDANTCKIQTMPSTTSIQKNFNLTSVQIPLPIYYITIYHDQLTSSSLYFKLKRSVSS